MRGFGRGSRGFSVLELLVVVAIAGVLLGIGFVAIPQDRFAVNEAAQIMAAQVTRTRFEAIKNNDAAWFEVLTSGAGGFRVCVDADADGSCDSSEVIQAVSFGEGDFGRVKLAAVDLFGSDDQIAFDRRGVPIGQSNGTITLANTSGSYQKILEVSIAGRVDIQ